MWEVKERFGVAVLALLLAATAALGQQATPQAGVPREVQPLLSTDIGIWMQGLVVLRADPRARELILRGLEAQPPPERRWRLAHHLAEFGTAEDVTALLPLLEALPPGQEQRVVVGTLHALYPTPPPGEDLTAILRDFAYLQTAPPVPFLPELERKYVLTELAVHTWWLDRIAPQVVERLLPLKGRRFDSQKAAAEALQSRLTPRLWQENGERLLAPLSPLPARLVQDGVLRYKLENTLARPLLVSVEAAAWFGRLEETPPRRYIYLRPGEAVQVDQPIRVSGPREPGRVRIDLHISEVNGGRLPMIAKLYVPMQG
jgi:hypothetical protein